MKVGNIKLMTGAVIANLRGEQLASDPSLASLVAAQEAVMWYNTTDKVYKYFNGSAIVALDGGSGEAPDLSGLVKADGSVAMTAALELSSDDQSSADSKAAVSKGHVDTQLAKKLTVANGALTANLSAGGFGISNLAAPVNSTDAARKIDIENALAGMNWQEDIDAVQTDDTLQPQKVAGKRYVLTDVTKLHADFGTIANVANNSIVEFKDSAFAIVFDPSANRADGAIAWNSATKQYVRYNGTVWSVFGGMASVTNGAGLDMSGNELSVKVDTDGGVTVGADGVGLKLNGSSLNLSTDGVKVADGGVGFNQLASAAFGTGLKRNTTTSAIELDTTAVKAAGFIDADGGEVASLVLTGEVAEVDGAVATRKFVLDNAGGNGPKAYVLDQTGSDVTAAKSYTFTHNAGIRFGTVTVYDADGKQIMPSEITLTDENNLTVDLPEEMKVVIVFVTGVNAYSAPVAPAGPTYTLILSDATSLTGETASRRKFAILHSSANDIKSVAWTFSGSQPIAAYGGNIAVFGTTSSDITGPLAGTITANITLNDSSTVTKTFDVNQAADTSDSGAFGSTFNVGVMGSSAASQQLKKESNYIARMTSAAKNTGFGLCDYNGNMWIPGTTTPGYPSQLLHSGETFVDVAWELVPLISTVSLANWKVTPSTNKFVANVSTTDDSAWFTANDNKKVARLVATATTSEGRKFIGVYTITVTTSGTAYAWSASVMSNY